MRPRFRGDCTDACSWPILERHCASMRPRFRGGLHPAPDRAGMSSRRASMRPRFRGDCTACRQTVRCAGSRFNETPFPGWPNRCRKARNRCVTPFSGARWRASPDPRPGGFRASPTVVNSAPDHAGRASYTRPDRAETQGFDRPAGGREFGTGIRSPRASSSLPHPKQRSVPPFPSLFQSPSCSPVPSGAAA